MSHIVYADGVQPIAEAGKASWLIVKIPCAQLDPYIRRHEFQLWTLTVKEPKKALITWKTRLDRLKQHQHGHAR